MQCKAAAFESGSPSCPRAKGLQGGGLGALGGVMMPWGAQSTGVEKQSLHSSLLPIREPFPFLQKDKKRRNQAALPLPHIFQKKTLSFPPSFSPVLISMHPPPFPCSFCVFSFMSIGQHFPWGRTQNQPNTHPAHSSGKNHSSSVLWHSPQTGSISPPQLPQAPNQAQPEQLQPGEGLELSFLEVTDGRTQIPAFGGADRPPD